MNGVGNTRSPDAQLRIKESQRKPCDAFVKLGSIHSGRIETGRGKIISAALISLIVHNRMSKTKAITQSCGKAPSIRRALRDAPVVRRERAYVMCRTPFISWV